MKSNTRFLWLTAAIFSLGVFATSCKDENVEVVGICPVVVSTNPANLATSVPLNQVISITFNGPIDPATVVPGVFALNGPTAKSKENGALNPDATTAAVSGSMVYEASTYTVRFTPAAPLTAGTLYTGTVNPTIKDQLGNVMQAPYTWTFSTGIILPAVVSTVPAHLAQSVPVNSVVRARFNQPMKAASLTTTSFTVNAGLTSVAGTVTYADSVATFTPTAALATGTLYTATITTAAATPADITLASNFVWTFNTSVVPPTVLSTDPANLATNVALDKVISVTFDQAMDGSTLTTSTFTLKNGTTPVSGMVISLGATASFTPTANLLSGTTYTAELTTGIASSSGTAMLSAHSWTFTTLFVPPTVQSVDPLDLASNVPQNKVISVVFSVPMDPLTITSTTFNLKNGVVAVPGTINYSGSTATFTPTSQLVLGVTYTGTVTTGAENVAGTPIASNFVWTFSTAAIAPTVQSVDPLNLATNVPQNKVISVVFSVPMDPLTITSTTFNLKNGLLAVPGTINYSGSTATFTPTSQLALGVTYTGTVTTGAENVAGTPIASDFVWTFSTSGNPPTVQSVDPIDQENNVPLNKVISVVFSEPMDPLTITATTFTLKIGATSVTGDISYLGSTATFTPSVNLLSGTTYTATVTTGAENVAGTGLASNYVWNFSTVAPLGPQGIDLVSVARFGIIAGVGVSNNAGFSEIRNMDVGIYPGVRSSITGFPPAIIVNGAIYASDDLAPAGTNQMLADAQADLLAVYLYTEAAVSPAPATVAGDIGGTTLAPGIYKTTSTLLIQSGDLTLDAQGDVNATWIFQIASDFTTVGGAGGSVILAGGAQAKNVYWQTGSSATIGNNTIFKGNILALTSITMNSGATAQGRMLARNGSVVMTSSNIIEKP